MTRVDRRLWQNLWVRLAVALAFADASIVVLALPQIVERLHTSISHSTWVILAYNLALIVASLAILPVAGRLPSRSVLVGGLGLFALASLGCGLASGLGALVALRCVQGVGGALVLCASLPLFAGVARREDSPAQGWSAAAAIGAAVGPAAGGVLTQLFDWRSIFFAQAPIAAIAAIAVLSARPGPADASAADDAQPRSSLGPSFANVALTLFSAALIGALFLVVVELINAWQLTPIAAAAIVTTIPLATALAERVVRGRSPVLLGATGALLLAAGLAGIALASYRQFAVVIVSLGLCGTGLGLAFPGLTAAALRGAGSATARAARTVAARDAGIVLGLLILTPVFVGEVNAAPRKAVPQIAATIVTAPIPGSIESRLVPALIAANASAPESRPPDIGPAFAEAAANATPSQRAELTLLRARLEAIIQSAVTHTFRRPLLYAAALALLVLPLLGGRVWYARRSASRRALSAG